MGRVLWQARTAGPVYALEALGELGLVAGDDAGFVTLLDQRGQQVWRFETGTRVTALHSLDGMNVLAAGWDERLSLVNSDGRAVWQKELAGPASQIGGSLSLAYAATLNGHLHAFTLAGAELWHIDLGETITQLAVHGQADNAFLLLGLQDGSLISLDRQGVENWRLALGQGGPVVSVYEPELGGQTVILTGNGGQEPNLALLSSDGKILWRIMLAASPRALGFLDLNRDGKTEIVAGLASGEVQAYDTDGRFLGSTLAGLPIWDLITLDDGSGMVLADVVAWSLESAAGNAGAAWLAPPAMLRTPPDVLSKPAARAAGETILAFLGDVSPSRSMETQLVRYGVHYPWTELGSLLHDADFVAANLESVLTTRGQPLDKSYLLRAHPMWGTTLLESGIDLVTLANNHALDYGASGLDETLSTLKDLGTISVGAGASSEAARRPALVTVGGVRVGFLAYAAARWNGSVDVPATDRLAWAVPDRVERDIDSIQDQVDLIIVLLHAGTEYATTPSPDQVNFAHAAIDAGADLVVGHHPHVTQTFEQYKQGLIVYSLGDALFDIPRQAAMRGDLLRVHVTQQGLVQAELWPFWIEDAIRPRLLDNGQGEPRFRIIYP